MSIQSKILFVKIEIPIQTICGNFHVKRNFKSASEKNPSLYSGYKVPQFYCRARSQLSVRTDSLSWLRCTQTHTDSHIHHHLTMNGVHCKKKMIKWNVCAVMPFFAPLCSQLEASFSVLLALTNKFNSFIPFSRLFFSPASSLFSTLCAGACCSHTTSGTRKI